MAWASFFFPLLFFIEPDRRCQNKPFISCPERCLPCRQSLACCGRRGASHGSSAPEKRGPGIGCAQMQITHGLGLLAATQGCPLPGAAAWYPCAKCRRICARQHPPSSRVFFQQGPVEFYNSLLPASRVFQSPGLNEAGRGLSWI